MRARAIRAAVHFSACCGARCTEETGERFWFGVRTDARTYTVCTGCERDVGERAGAVLS